MIKCPYCGYANYEGATECRKCEAAFVTPPQTIYKSLWCGPETARTIRKKALAAITLGILIKVYWGGYGPWPVIDNPSLVSLRGWLEPLLLYGGTVAYLAGVFLQWV